MRRGFRLQCSSGPIVGLGNFGFVLVGRLALVTVCERNIAFALAELERSRLLRYLSDRAYLSIVCRSQVHG